ncbi:alpha/beta fold hydrolase [Streptomyces sp. WAC06614]|uniref:alpha/beta fold hydrolase n=1 Tax=Streptomyces sp. WAC06614 TaxID=2487416 RepID=UPI000F7B4FDC|nr:alpha/beta fold hydrolase [Streptomyces sp. WAC06614]RSS76880.1 alpha/beta fold hydrolase [Streptomyces sp. WAC06614]
MSKPPLLALPAAAHAYTLHTARGDFAVHEAGRPVLGTALLVPGFTGSKEDFVGLLEPLAAAGYRVVAVDGRGQYQSPGPRDEAAYALDELARDLLAQAAALMATAGTATSPLHLVGHSFGGLVSRAAVLREPTAFTSLTLMSSGPAAIAPDQQDRTKLLIAALEMLREDMPAVWEAMRAQEEDAVLDSPELAAFLRERWLGTVPEQLIATGRVLISEPDRVAELAELTDLPKLVLSGAVDYAWPVPWLDDMAQRLGAQRQVIPGTAHSPNAEDPEATARALTGFWGGAVEGQDRG